MREIDAAFQFELPSGMHPGQNLRDRFRFFGFGTFPGRLKTIPARCRDRLPGTRQRVRGPHRDIPPIQSSLPLHRADQILAPDAVCGQCERGGSVSNNSAIQKRHGASKPAKIHTIEAALKIIRRIGQKLRIERAGNFSSKKIGLGLPNPDRPSCEFRFAVELFDMHRRNVDHAGAKPPARREACDDGVGWRRGDGVGIRAGKSRQKPRSRARSSQRSRSAASRWSAERSKAHCLSEYFRAIEPCQTAPNASAADTVMIRCNGANSTWALGKRTGWLTYAGLKVSAKKIHGPKPRDRAAIPRDEFRAS